MEIEEGTCQSVVRSVMTRQESIAANTEAVRAHWVPGQPLNAEGRAATHAVHVAYYKQFITPAVRHMVAPFVQQERMPSIDEIDRVMIPCPSCVAKLMREAGDYPTPNDLVCIFKLAYELGREQVAFGTERTK